MATDRTHDCDVVVVGASVAGCTAACLFAARGFKVALLERSHEPDAFKKACTHFIQPGAVPVLQEIGAAEAIERAGGVRNHLEVWTEYGWIRSANGPRGYNIRRQTLDPLLREAARRSPGVTYEAGHTVKELVRSGARIAGVRAESRDGSVLVVRARLVVAADGRHSDIADCAALPVQRWPNNRFTYFTYFRNLELRGGANSQYWHMGKRFAYAFANDAGTTLLGCFMPIEELPQWRGNVEHAFMRFWEQVPDAPHLRTADRCGEMRGVIKHPNQRREMTAPGLALIGDALLSVDPIWGTGCGWAIESSAWLVDAVAPALAPGAPAHDVDRAVLRYARKHRRATNAHVDHICSLSTGRSTNWAENRIFEAGVSDPIVAASVLAYFGRIQPPSSLFAPRVLARAARTLVKHSVARLSAVTEHTS